MAKKRDWVKIRTEYETTKTSYRKLAEKYGIPFPTIRDRAKREGWAASAKRNREDIVTKVIAKTSQRLADRRAARIVDEIDPALEATELINKIVLDALKDELQFKRHLVQVKEKSPQIVTLTTSTGKQTERVMSVENQNVEERIYDVVDTKRLADLAKALQISKELQRTLLGLLSPADKAKIEVDEQKIQLAKEKLELDKAAAAQKSQITDEGIIIQMEGELNEWSE